ncbi:MAG TPA: YfiR family protein [Gammaproteobacteria bacterium]|nr:YfiR family protein [Gammaproteobacteria bacterium]
MPFSTLICRGWTATRFASARCAWLAIAVLATESVTAEVLSEAQIKAAFLYNFTRFVEWPEEAFAAPHDPLVIGVLGESALTEDLRSIVAGRKINGRAIVVRNVENESDAAATQVLFVSAAGDARLGALHDSLADRAVLTVGESSAFASAGGVISFVEHAGKLRFEINTAAAARARVKVSAELQKLATAVRSAP